MHKHEIAQEDPQEEHHLVGRNVSFVLAVVVSQVGDDGVEEGLGLEMVPFLLGQGTDVLLALLLVGELVADELVGEQQKGDAEDKEGRDEPQSEGQQEETALVFALGAYSFEQDEELVFVGCYVFHGFPATPIHKNIYHSSQGCSITPEMLSLPLTSLLSI